MGINFTASPTVQQTVALLTLSAVAISAFTLHNNQKKIMPRKKNKQNTNAATESSPDLGNARFIFGSFKNSREQSLFTINLPQKGTSCPPKAMFFLSHGVMEHCCRPGYIGLYESLSEAGVDVYSFDHHGHGRSEGEPRGYAEEFDHYVEDLLGYIKQSQKKYIDGGVCPPLILMGQSMGGLISVMAVLKLGSYHVKGLILTAPALGVDMNMELKIQKFFAPAIDKLLPKSRIVDAVHPADLSRNPKAVQAYIDDPLVTKGKLVARTAIQTDKSFDLAKERRGEITCPLLLLHGTGDKCTSITAAQDFFENVGTDMRHKRFLQLPGLYHELFEEGDASDEIMVGVVEFASSGGKQFAEISGEEKNGLVSVVFK